MTAPTQNREVLPSARPDWFVLSWRPYELSSVPGVQLHKTGRPLVHRSHLALLGLDNMATTVVDPALVEKMLATGFTLRPYQHEQINYELSREGSIIAYQMRLGKTAGVVSAFHTGKLQLPALIVAPLATKDVWKRHFEAILGLEVELNILTGRGAYGARVGDFNFCHPEIVSGWANVVRPKTLIVDEAHQYSNRKAKRTEGIMFAGGFATRRILLTGTPLWNNLDGLHSLLHIATPGAFGSKSEFLKRYAAEVNSYGKPSGVQNEIELCTRLDQVMIRRTWQEVLDQVPQITRDVHLAELPKEVEAAVDEEVAKWNDFIGTMARVRHRMSLEKAEAAGQAARSILEVGEKVVVWVWHKEAAQVVGRVCEDWPSMIITGDTPHDTRDRALQRWREHEGAVMLIMSIAIGQAGIDLSAAQHAIFAEQDYTPAVMSQAEARTFSPTRPSTIQYVVADHWIDRAILGALIRKVEIGQKIGAPAAESAIDIIQEALSRHDGDNTVQWSTDPREW